MRTFITFCLFLALAFQVSAQHGNLYLTHFQHRLDYLDYRVQSISQDEAGMMYFAHRTGVLKFDGVNWLLINTEHMVYDLAPFKNQLFLAGKNDFGYIIKASNGTEKYYSLANPDLSRFEYRKVYVLNHKVYFQADQHLIQYDPVKKEITQQWITDKDESFSMCFENQNRIFVQIENRGLFKVNGQSLEPVVTDLPDQESLVFAETYQNKTILGGLSNRLYWFDGKNIDTIAVEQQEYLQKSQIADAKLLANGWLAIATVQGGSMFLNMQTGKTEYFLNYQTGLPDNEVFTIGADKNGGIWLAHEYGFTRADFQIPIRNFTYQGLEGNILAIMEQKNTLYVGTSNGLYYLTEIKDFKEIQTLIPKLIKKQEKTNQKGTSPEEQKNTQEDINDDMLTKMLDKVEKYQQDKPVTDDKKEEKKGGFLGLFRKKTDEEKAREKAEKEEKKRKKEEEKRRKKEEKNGKKAEETKAENANTVEIKPVTPVEKTETVETEKQPVEKKTDTKKDKSKTKPKPKPQTNKPKTNTKANPNTNTKAQNKTYLALQSIKYLFRKIEGIEGKCRQIIDYQGSLIVVSTTGLYRVVGEKAEKISDKNCRFVYISLPSKKLFASTLDNELMILPLADKKMETAEKNGNSEKTAKKAKETKPKTEKSAIEKPKAEYFTLFAENISRITQDKAGQIWVCGTDSLYQLFFSAEGQIQGKKAFGVQNRQMAEILPLHLDSKLYFVMPQKAYLFKINQLVPDTTILAKAKTLWAESDQIIWGYDGRNWERVGSGKAQAAGLLNYLNPIDKIFAHTNERFGWVITQSQDLYRLDFQAPFSPKAEYKLLLDNVKDDKGTLYDLNNLAFQYNSGTLIFNFTYPDFLNGRKVEYQYRLLGKMNDWSEWSNSGTVIFPLLDDGSYTLQVRCRDSFGNLQESEMLKFDVLPPYWKTFWFMTAELIFFASIFYLTYKVNEKISIRNKYMPWVRRGMTLLTLILIIEFFKVTVQRLTNLDGSSPVEDFGIEVFMALFLLPIEVFLTSVFKRKEKEVREREV